MNRGLGESDGCWRAQCKSAEGMAKRSDFHQVFTSSLQRAVRICELAGFGSVAEVACDLVEWNYGGYEGRTGAETTGM